MLAGVTALGGGEYAVAETMSTRFESALKSERPEMRFVGLPEARILLGGKNIESYEKWFSENGMLSPKLWIALESLHEPSKYLAWIDLNCSTATFNVSKSEEVTYRIVKDPNTGEKRKAVDSVDYETSSTVARRISAEFSIYEIESRRKVWSATIGHHSNNSSSRTDSFHYPQPATVWPPGTFELLEDIIVKAAKLLLRP